MMDSKAGKWTVGGALSALVLAMAGYFANGQGSVLETMGANTERIRALEVQQDNNTKRLKRIEDKLDVLIQRGR